MPRILVVDDDQMVVKLVQITLSRFGYTILSANDGLQALRMAKSENPDLIVLEAI